MIPVLLVVLMQAGGAYTHLPKLTLFPTPVTAPAIAAVVPKDAPLDLCSVRMPRMAIPKGVHFTMLMLKAPVIDAPSVAVPAPECPAPASDK